MVAKSHEPPSNSAVGTSPQSHKAGVLVGGVGKPAVEASKLEYDRPPTPNLKHCVSSVCFGLVGSAELAGGALKDMA